MRKKANGHLREHDLTPAAADELARLMTDASAAHKRYVEASAMTIRLMGIGAPKEGHIWLVDPVKRKVREQPQK